MRQWKTTLLNDYTLDLRTRQDILDKMRELAASYTPEWQFDVENPDIGSCIALLYADEMQELIRRYNTIPERNCVELVNMLNISLKAAYPAHSVVLMDLIDNTVPGIKLPKGVKLLADGGENQEITFETANTVYVTNSQIKTVFMTSGITGNIYPIMGDFPQPSYIEQGSIVVNQTKEEEQDSETELESEVPYEQEGTPLEEPDGTSILSEVMEKSVNTLMTSLQDLLGEMLQDEIMQGFPFRMFQFDRPDYGLHGMLLYHSHLFDVQDNDILMELKGGEEIIAGILSGEYELKYFAGNEFVRITDITKESPERIVFRKQLECGKVMQNGTEYSVLLIEPTAPITKTVMVSKIGFSSAGKPEALQNVWNGNCELEALRFAPFGEVMTMYAELYMNHEEYFTKPGALIRIEFTLEFGRKVVSIPRYVEEDQLKVIKKKPKRDIYGVPAEVYADEIIIEYFNGIGWKRLPTTAPVSQMFRNVKEGKCEIEFECPKDWKNVEEGSSEGHWLRLRLLKADNCYYQPSVHNYPVICNLMVSYSYDHRLDTPQKLLCFQGSRKRDMTIPLAENPYTPVFFRNPYNTTSLYLGLDKRMEDGFVSMLIDVEEMEGYTGRDIRFYYSTRDGFKRLKLIDNTNGLEHSGTIVFMPPTDMAKRVIEGEEAYWIRITDEKLEMELEPNKCPVINRIRMNAVEVNNIDTLNEQDYYIDQFGPNMIFALNTDNILDADVWVNETDCFTESEMRSMLIEQPAVTRAEYNLGGGIQEFYIKWQEVDNFDNSCASDRHYVIDRQNHMLLFGDGVHCRIPKNTRGIAFKVVVRRCEGSLGNVNVAAINSSLGNLMFVNNIYNPIPAYGGTDMETLDEALRRGASQLGSKNRLISAKDYEREVLDFSNAISQAKVVVNTRKDGTNVPGAISIVMSDFKDGDHSFLKMKSRIREHLLTKCELSVDERYLSVVQPLFVRVSAEIWVRLIETDDSFDLQQHFISVLEQYLDPVSNEFWEIGKMVSAKQIGMKLNIEKGSTLIEKVMFSAKYEDENGMHEADLSALQGNPYVLVMNGEHKIHFL